MNDTIKKVKKQTINWENIYNSYTKVYIIIYIHMYAHKHTHMYTHR